MKRLLLPILFFLSLSANNTTAQNLSQQVMQLFETKCGSCHNNSSPQSGLDLQGKGTTALAKSDDVFSHLVNISPSNAEAKAKGDRYIYPGRPDRSYLFRKINEDFDTDLSLSANEGSSMPKSGAALSEYEKELVRQWIMYGAPKRDSEVSAPGFADIIPNITDYYINGNGMDSYPDGPPPAPDPSEGFQIKMGPFFVAPSGELELFQKYELDLEENVEVARVDMDIATFSHHLIIYDFNSRQEANAIRPGYRSEADHEQSNLVAAVQEPTDLNLPKGAAFFWDKDLVLDLNSHYINYSVNQTYKAESYINVYTQESGTASQEMYTILIPNFDIFIPNNEQTTTISSPFTFDVGNIFVWGVMGHTHQYGTGYKVFLRNNNGSKGNIMYDAACGRGIPGCNSPYFDYRHIPMRYFDDELLEVDLKKGIIHEGTWFNDGSKNLRWGNTSKDEMMVMIVMYVNDTTGIATSSHEVLAMQEPAKIYPNPMSDFSIIELPALVQNVDFSLYDVLGRPVRKVLGIREQSFIIEKEDLERGIYLYRIEEKDGRFWTGKLVVE